MANLWLQLGLLLWKNFQLKRAEKLSTVVEIFLPSLLISVLVVFRELAVFKLSTGGLYYSLHIYPCGGLTGNCVSYDAKNVSSDPYVLHNVKIFLYSPNNTRISQLMNQVKNNTNHSEITSYRGFATQNEVIEEANRLAIIYSPQNTAAVIPPIVVVHFEKDLVADTKQGIYQYTIRMPSISYHEEFNFQTSYQYGRYQWARNLENSRDGSENTYNDPKGFLYLQHNIDKSIMQFIAATNNVEREVPTVKIRRFPYPFSILDPFRYFNALLLPLFIVFSFIVSVPYIIKKITYEKQIGMKQYMSLVGIPKWLHWVAWFITLLLLMVIPCTVITAMLCLPIGRTGAVLALADPILLFIILITYTMSSISFCFMISMFFQEAANASTAGIIIYFTTYIPYLFLWMNYRNFGTVIKLALCIFSNTAAALAFTCVSFLEVSGYGLSWSNIMLRLSPEDGISVFYVLLMLLGDSVLYMLIARYVEAIKPGLYGVPKPWYFIFFLGMKNPENIFHGDEEYEEDELDERPTGHFEKVKKTYDVGIRINNLTKIYRYGKVVTKSLRELSIKIYQGQITALLGHNGAGKTTLFSILTGMTSPSSGDATIAGYNIRRHMDKAQQQVGLCPQHNLVFDELSVFDHLFFFAMLKGIESTLVLSEVTSWMRKINLTAKKKVAVRLLSGGMKRKLLVAMAMIGDSPVLLLDEPSSGLDSAGKRSLWILVREARDKGHTILLSTQHMEEAEEVGDRIAILVYGKLQSYGSCRYLMAKYGTLGYRLTVTCTEQAKHRDIIDLIQYYIPAAQLLDTFSLNDICFYLPVSYRRFIPKLFFHLETHKEQVGIVSFGIGTTSVQEAFRKATQDVEEHLAAKLPKKQRSGKAIESKDLRFEADKKGAKPPPFVRNMFTRRIMNQFSAQVRKHYYYSRRSPLTIMEIVIPVFWFAIAHQLLYSSQLKQLYDPEPQMVFSPEAIPLYTDIDVPYKTYGLSLMGIIYLQMVTSMNGVNKVLDLSKVASMRYIDINQFLTLAAKQNLQLHNERHIIAAEFYSNSATVYFSNQALHAMPITVNLVHNAMLKSMLSNKTIEQIRNNPAPIPHRIVTVNNPLRLQSSLKPLTYSYIATDTLDGWGQLVYRFYYIVFTVINIIGISFAVTSFIQPLIKEKGSNAKHLQLLSGLELSIYWLSKFVWDYFILCVSVSLIALYCLVMQSLYVFEEIEGTRTLIVCIVYLAYGWAALPFFYLCSFPFTIAATGFGRLASINILTGFVSIIGLYAVEYITQCAAYIVGTLHWILLFVPNYAFADAIYKLFYNFYLIDNCEVQDIGHDFCNDLLYFETRRDNKDGPYNSVFGIIATFSFKFVPIRCNYATLGRLERHVCCPRTCDDYFPLCVQPIFATTVPGIGSHMLCMFLQGLLYWSQIFIIELNVYKRVFRFLGRLFHCCCCRCHCCRKEKPDDEWYGPDEDVLAERDRIVGRPYKKLRHDYPVILADVTKKYSSFLAVNRICLAVNPGECFGLLGINGAGKTTTIKMLTGDHSITSGVAFLMGDNIVTSTRSARQQLGYCPQFDALFDRMTGRETLTMYAHMHGIEERHIPRVVNHFMRLLKFEIHADKLICQYSGGNKRKLSVAIAFIGNPRIVILDEPTTGMDPVTKCYLWDLLKHIKDLGSKSIILTSHSLLECETLCDRMGIMVNGQFHCLGTSQYIKHKYHQGYNVTIICHGEASDDSVDEITEYFEHFCASADMTERRGSTLKFYIPVVDVPLSRMFKMLARAKQKFDLKDYTLAETTLQDVFLALVDKQADLESPSQEERRPSSFVRFVKRISSFMTFGQRPVESVDSS